MIFIDKIELPKLDEKKFYYNDLIHMKAYIKKKQVGVVMNVKNHGAGDYLEILDKKKEILVPFKTSLFIKSNNIFDTDNSNIFTNFSCL